jgi:hypothetical protein
MVAGASYRPEHGVCFSCSVFTWVKVALLAEAEAPELKHLWVFADDKPCAAGQSWKAKDCQHSEPEEKNRHRDEYIAIHAERSRPSLALGRFGA